MAITLTPINRRDYVLQCDDPQVMMRVRQLLTCAVPARDSVLGIVGDTDWHPFYWETSSYATSMVVPAGLVPRLIPKLREERIPVGVASQPVPTLALQVQRSEGTLTFRDWQYSLIQKTTLYAQGIVQVPTSGGKSFAIGGIALNALRQGVNVLILVPTETILTELLEKLKALIPDQQLGAFYGRVKSLNRVTVAIPESVLKNAEQVKAGGFGVLMVDEAHRAIERTISVVNLVNPTCLYGFSASALVNSNIREPLSSLSLLEWKLLATFGEVIYYIPPGTMDADSVLPFLYFQVWHQPAKIYGTSDWHAIRSAILESPEALNLYVQLCTRLAVTGTNTLCLVPTKKFGMTMAESLSRAGIEVALSFGGGWCELREERVSVSEVREWLQGAGRVLIATSHLDEGADKIVSNIHNAVLAVGGGKTERKLLQRVGRVLRPNPGKEFALVIDTYDSGSGVTQKHSDHRMQTAKLLKAVDAIVVTPEQMANTITELYGGTQA